MNKKSPIFVAEAPVRKKPSVYPEPFASMMAGREKRPIGDLFDLKNFGVNLTTLLPGSVSALHHIHSVQDELVYIVSGTPTLILGNEEQILFPGMAVGFPARGKAHHLRNDTDEVVTYLEIGDRSAGDVGTYPNNDLIAENVRGDWIFKRKDGSAY